MRDYLIYILRNQLFFSKARKLSSNSTGMHKSKFIIEKNGSVHNKGVFKWGFRGFNPPPEIFRFFWKSEGKEIERKRKKKMLGGGGNLLTYFWG